MSAISEVQKLPVVELASLLDAGDGAVVTLLAGETQLAAHKAVLTTRSPVFAAMFQHDTLEARSGQVAIADVEGPVLRQLVAYMYTLQAPQLPDMAPQLLAAADKYGLSALKDVCEQQVAAQLAVENAAAAGVLAVRHSCPSLTAAAVDFIRVHSFQVMATQGWADAVHSQPEDVIALSKLFSEPPLEDRTPAAATPGTHRQPHSDHGSGAPATAAAPTAARHVAPPDDAAVSRFRTPAAATPGTHRQPHSDHGSGAPAPPAAPTAARHVAPPDDAAVSRFRSLSQQERNRRLIEAAQEGAVPELRALLAAGADAGVREEGGWRWTALHYAAGRGHEEAARRLVEGGAEVDATDSEQWTPLHLAAHSGHAAVVRLLLAASADPNARDQSGRTPLHLAALWGRAEAAAALLEGGADRAARNNRGETPLDVARQYNKQQLIQLLTP